ncbi:MAG: hypothetical protein A4E26_00037 [Methanobacterium sp. PtaU1.Bin097]|jgi:hypothetical protein|nr:MAG: hypothetical protein A4E26_00037 [Methanobacterium sp. PtaU1.Bin097]
MGSVDISIKDEATPFLEGKVNDFIPQAVNMMDNVADTYKGYLEADAPVGETHELADLSMWEPLGLLERFIFSGSGHFDWVVGGTAAHDIYPVNAKALYWPEADHPVKHVYHPGTEPNDYPSEAFESADSEIDNIINEFAGWIVE